MAIDLTPVTEALKKAADRGAPVYFWLRDDDAVTDTPELCLLEAWAGAAHTQVLLAVIPAKADEKLAAFVAGSKQLCPCVHGWAHKNHASEEEKKMELGDHRPPNIVCGELKTGLKTVYDLFGGDALAVLVPPWNRISDQVVEVLPSLGFEGLSTFGSEVAITTPNGLKVVNCQLDLIDWRGTRKCRPHDELVRELAGHIEERAPDGLPIGILGHHLVHDDAAWQFLHELLEVTRSGEARFVSPRDVFDRA